MMQHLFISPEHIVSPRWLEAFDQACVTSVAEPRTDALVWLVLQGDKDLQRIQAWSALGHRLVVMTTRESAAEARKAIAAGARGYVHYLAVAPLLQQLAQVVELGGVWIGAELMKDLMSLAAIPVAASPVNPRLAQLTPRERAVVEAVAAGKTNKEVARLLDITERTVKAHLGAIFNKLGVRDRLQLVLLIGSKT